MTERIETPKLYADGDVLWIDTHRIIGGDVDHSGELPFARADANWLADRFAETTEEGAGYGFRPVNKTLSGYRMRVEVIGHESFPVTHVWVRSDGSGDLPRGEWRENYRIDAAKEILGLLRYAPSAPPRPTAEPPKGPSRPSVLSASVTSTTQADGDESLSFQTTFSDGQEVSHEIKMTAGAAQALGQLAKRALDELEHIDFDGVKTRVGLETLTLEPSGPPMDPFLRLVYTPGDADAKPFYCSVRRELAQAFVTVLGQ